MSTTGIRHICLKLSPFDHQEQITIQRPLNIYNIDYIIKKIIL